MPFIFMCLQAPCYHSILCTLFSGCRHGGTEEILVLPGKEIKNEEKTSLAGYELAERKAPA